MAFDANGIIAPLCSVNEEVWSSESIDELKKQEGKMQTLQLNAVSYLWELCYDLLLANGENVSASPGFESLGLRGGIRAPSCKCKRASFFSKNSKNLEIHSSRSAARCKF